MNGSGCTSTKRRARRPNQFTNITGGMDNVCQAGNDLLHTEHTVFGILTNAIAARIRFFGGHCTCTAQHTHTNLTRLLHFRAGRQALCSLGFITKWSDRGRERTSPYAKDVCYDNRCHTLPRCLLGSFT